MKSKFIKHTNKQYSIREDGEVIMHYKLTYARNKTRIGINKLMTKYGKNSKYVTIVKDSVNKSITINTLLKEYFGYTLCTQCNCKITDGGVKCIKCIKANEAAYAKRVRYKYVEQRKLADQRIIDEVGPSYVASLFRCKVAQLTPEIINAKRQQIKLHRTWKEQKTN
jgi:hypothetical protein